MHVFVAITEEEKSIRQAQTLAEQGFIGKACKAIGTNRVLDGSSATVKACLVTKHPVGDFAMHDPPLQTMPYHAQDAQAALRKCANGSAPAWSGWTKELLNAACRTDPDLFHHLAVFLSRLRACTDVRLAELVRVGKLIALNNARSPSDPEDPRPITISELFSKLLGLIAMAKSRWCLDPSQRGLNHKGGTHQAVVEVQRAYDADTPAPLPPDARSVSPPIADGEQHSELHVPTPPSLSPSPPLRRGGRKIVATFDVSNAFNATLRIAIKRKLVSMGMSAMELLEYFRWMYGSQSDIFIRSRSELEMYRSCEGVRQGDMPASLLFSLVFTDAAIAAAQRTLPDVLHALWLYLDDITLVETVDTIINFKVELEKELEDVGLSLNMRKCRALVDRCTEEEIARLAGAGFQLDRGCTRVLGSPVGETSACRQFVLDKITKWQPFWEKVRHNLLAPFTAMQILGKCGNVKFHHLAKSLPPGVCHDAAVIFDAMVDDSIDAILGRQLDSVEPHVRRAVVHLQPYAVIGATLYENTIKLLAGERACDKISVHHAMVQHYERLPLTPFVGPLIVAVQGVTAADTFRPTTTLTDADAVTGLLLRHGVAPRYVPTLCSCGFFFGRTHVGVETIHHLMHCPDNVGKTHTTRQHQVVRAIQAVLSMYGVCSIWEPSNLHPFLRPDLHIISLAMQMFVDVTIVDDVFSCDPEALKRACDEKHQKYDALAEDLKMSFFAVPLSSFGKLHAEAHRFIDAIAAKCVNQFRRSDFKKDVRSAMQHALLKGTADVANCAVARLCGKCADWIE